MTQRGGAESEERKRSTAEARRTQRDEILKTHSALSASLR
jgi:hypothetical protein